MVELKKYHILAGQVLITSAPALIKTVLGSCVAVCLWDRESNLGGMNHYLLPGVPEDDADNLNRGLPATRKLIESLLRRNVKPENIEAKVFGGCNSLYINNDLYKVGERNIATAFEVLNDFGIPVKAHDTAGARGRLIVFNTLTGKVRMRLLNKPISEINEEINKGFGN